MDRLLLLLLALSVYNGDSAPLNNSTVFRIGNEIQSSLSGVDTRGAVFLQRNIVLREGVLFAYSAYFRNNKRVRFQVWRPEPLNTTSTYRLLAETQVTPSVELQREDIYIESRLTDRCIRVKEGDRLGILFEESPGAIPYVVDDSPAVLGHRLSDPNKPYSLDDVVEFDALLYPYDFSVAAYVDTDGSHYVSTDADQDFVSCFPHVLIPDYGDLTSVGTTQNPAGATGATGPMGATGDQGPPGYNGAWGAPGEMGATGSAGATGPMGATGGVGATGVHGERGQKGAQGDRGERGEQGPAGPPGEMVVVQKAANTNNLGDSFYSKNEMSLTYLIWLIVLSIAIIILIIITCILISKVGRHQKRDETVNANDENFPGFDTIHKIKGDWKVFLTDESASEFNNENTNMEFLTVPGQKQADNSSASWKDYLKAETETIYSHATLTRNPSIASNDEGAYTESGAELTQCDDQQSVSS